MAKDHGMQQYRHMPRFGFLPNQADRDEAGTSSRTSEIELQHHALRLVGVKLIAPSRTVTHFTRPTKPRIYTAKEWEAMRSRIYDLYIIRNRSLLETRDLLARKDGFNATMQMYKRRLKQRGIAKTIPSSQKDALVRLAQDCIRQDEALPTCNLEGKSIDWHKVRRRDWESGVRQKMWLNVELPAKPSMIIRPITPREPTELLVYNITDCVPSQPSGSSRALLAGRFEMPVLFEDAIRFVADGYEHSVRRKFDEAGVMAQRYLQNVPISLLPQLLRVILDLNWKICPAHQRLVFEILQRICVQSLGHNDMLTKFVALLTQQYPTRIGREAVWTCVLHSLSQ